MSNYNTGSEVLAEEHLLQVVEEALAQLSGLDQHVVTVCRCQVFHSDTKALFLIIINAQNRLNSLFDIAQLVALAVRMTDLTPTHFDIAQLVALAVRMTDLTPTHI